MKKLISLFAILCMVFTMIPALAETVEIEVPPTEETVKIEVPPTEETGVIEQDVGVDLSTLLNGLFGSDENGEEGFHFKELVSSLFGGEKEETKKEEAPAFVPPALIAAESKEQFFGAWNLSWGTIFGVPVALDDIATALKIPLSLQLVLADGTFILSLAEDKPTDGFEMELVDGALRVTKNGEPETLYLNENGELVMDFDIAVLYFTPAPVDAV